VNFDAQKLYELLPAIYRIRDAECGEPLKALFEVIASQAGAMEQNLAQLYDDQFVETCAPWALPYIGDLIGITGLPGSTVQTLTPRAEVAHTIGYRRRKGTAAMLEQLARDVSGWPARAAEFFQLISATQYMNHLRPENQSFICVRNANRLEYLGSAFERGGPAAGSDLTHTADVRQIESGHGSYNIPNIGIFLWRLRAMPLTRSHAVPAAATDAQRFFFNPLGLDQPLFNLPETETEVTHLAERTNVPDRITRRVLAAAFDTYYGKGKSLLLELAESDISVEPDSVPADQIKVCDLSDWSTLPQDKIALDPVLGRIAFPEQQARTVLVSFHYGFSANMGGGEYTRLSQLDSFRRTDVGRVSNTYVQDTAQTGVLTTIGDAFAALGSDGGVVEIVNSGRYVENVSIDATSTNGKHIELRAADKRRPVLMLYQDLMITGGPNDEVQLDGLLIAGGTLRVGGRLGTLRIRHCTLVPGISRDSHGEPVSPDAPSLVVDSVNTSVEIDQSILGSIQSAREVEVTIQNSIIDATDDKRPAYVGIGGTKAFGAPARVTNSVVIGLVRASIIRLASNCIFLAASETSEPVLAERRQEGCVRFSYVPPHSRTPARYRCQPENDDLLIRPQFVSTRFHDPGYCQLSAFCPPQIRNGADDDSEMGAFHDLYEPQREAHLKTRVTEYLRFGLEAGLFYAT